MRGTIDGNEAAVDVAYRLTELCAIYPITPSSTMAELADDWASARRTNIWGTVPTIMEMQSEAGAAGAMHGALQGGAMSTTYTASQGLLLMIPNMYKIAGELTSTVFQVAARSLAAQGLSIFGDHSDVMAVRQTGFALLSSASVQEAHDFALIAQAATLRSRVPFLHFFDGFRTSHEVTTMERLEDDDLRALVSDDLVREHRRRALTPERPFIRGTAQNPDVYFQGRETVNPYYARVGGIVQESMDALAERTGRAYRLVEYSGHPEATRVIVVMGSGGVTARETVRRSSPPVRRSACCSTALPAVPGSRARRRAAAHGGVDRRPRPDQGTRIHGRAAVPRRRHQPQRGSRRGQLARMPRLIGGRYGLSSKEFTPGMVAGIFAELASESPRPGFTIGINDDVSGMSLRTTRSRHRGPCHAAGTLLRHRSDGDGWGEQEHREDPRRGPAGARPGLLRLRLEEVRRADRLAPALRPGTHRRAVAVTKAGFVGIHDFTLLDKVDILPTAQDGATLLLNSPHPADQVWDSLPVPVQQEIIDRRLRRSPSTPTPSLVRPGCPGGRTPSCRPASSPSPGAAARGGAGAGQGDHPQDLRRRGQEVVRRNEAAVDSAAAAMAEIPVPVTAGTGHPIPLVVPDTAPSSSAR